VHFHPSGSTYQTTPGMSMGRAGFKQPGYRSVKRCLRSEDNPKVVIYCKAVHGEWRIAANEEESELDFEEEIPANSLVDALANNAADTSAGAQDVFRAWRGEDLTSGAWDVPIVVWQWCRGVPERQGNLMALGDEWWCPYLAEDNNTIEEAFSREDSRVEITVNERQLNIRFDKLSSFALQRDEELGKERTIRRIVKTIQELKVMLDRMTTPPPEPSEVAEKLPHNSIPNHYLCPITQDIMNDPVKTVDGMTYDRPAIERWLAMRSTSPLTGLPLSSKALTPNAELREHIEQFVNQHAHLVQRPSAPPTADLGSMTLNAGS